MTVRLEKRKNEVYYIVVDLRKEGGKREYISTGTKKLSEAKKELGEYQHKVNTNTYLPTSKTLFTTFLRSWLDEYVSINCRESTKQSYELCANVHIIPWFEKLNLTLGEITPMVVQKYYNEKLKSGLSGNTIRKHHANIRKCLDYAKKMQLITINPSDSVELPKKVKFHAKFYTKDQVLKLFENVLNTEIETAVVLAVSLGLRRGEVLGLRWADIDCENATMNITNNRVRYKTEIIGKPKSEESIRRLDIPAYVLNYLIGLKNNSEFLGEYVCTWPDGTPLRTDYVSKKFKGILEKNNMPLIRFHDLRHTNASLLISQGVDLKRIQGWLGHAQISTTNIYSHLLEDYKKDNANILNNIFSPEK